MNRRRASPCLAPQETGKAPRMSQHKRGGDPSASKCTEGKQQLRRCADQTVLAAMQPHDETYTGQQPHYAAEKRTEKCRRVD